MSRILLHSIYTVVVSIVLNVIVFFIGTALSISWATSDEIIGVGAVIIASIIGAAIGIIGFLVLRFFLGERSRIWFIWLATIFGVLSLFGPWAAASDIGTLVFLGMMHVVSVLVMTWYLGVWAPTYIAAAELIAPSS